MSLLSRSRLRVALAPDKVAAVLMTTGRRARVQARGAWVCQPLPSDAYPWQASIRALVAGLADMAVEGADASFVLSSHFVRYLMLPWSDQVTSSSERQAMARISFEGQFGSRAGAWAIKLSDDAYGKAALASAVDAALPESILQLCGAAKFRPAAIEPYLMTVFNQHRRQLVSQDFCLVVTEPFRVSLLMASAGAWHAVRTAPIRHALSQELGPLIQRETLLAGLPMPAQIYLHAQVQEEIAAPSAFDMPVKVLPLAVQEGFLPNEPLYAMAMSGVP